MLMVILQTELGSQTVPRRNARKSAEMLNESNKLTFKDVRLID